MKARKDDIKTLVKIPDILSAFGIRADRNRIQCPIRDHKRDDPSFKIKSDTWTCYACNDSGDIFALAMALSGRDFQDSLDWICEQFKIPNNGIPDPEFKNHLKQRRKAAQEREQARKYQNYVWGRLCNYLHYLESLERTELIDSHVSWCHRILDRVFNGEVLFDGSDVFSDIDCRLRGMWQQLQ